MTNVPVIAVLLLASVSCKTGAGARVADADVQTPLITQLDAAGADVGKAPFILPSEHWAKLGEGPGGRAARIAMLADLLKATAARLKGLDLAAILQSSFGIDAEAAATMGATELDELLKSDPTRLDRFPTLSLSDVPKVQALLFSLAKPDPTAGEPRPFPAATILADVELRFQDEGCAAPVSTRSPAIPELGLHTGGEPLTQRTVGCFHQNSAHLAQLLNRLTNTAFGEAPEVRVHFGADDGDDAAAATLGSHEALAQLLEDAGYAVEIFQTRVIADFLDYSVRDGDTSSFRPLRLNLWIDAKVGGKSLRLPAEHGELGLLIHRDGKRFAQVRYFLGVPDPERQSVGSYWRATTRQDPSWSARIRERVEAFRGYQLKGVVPWLDAVAAAMKGFQAVFDRHHLPFNSYGTFVCTDSLAMAAAARQMRAGSLVSRTTNAFPIVRAPVAEALAAQYAGIPLAKLRAVYPADQELESEEPARFEDRIRAAFPRDLDGRFAAFPEVKAQLGSLRAGP